MHPDTAWVEDNILPVYLATSQKLACESHELIKPDGQKYKEQGYVDVSELKFKIPLEDDPINKLQYMAAKGNQSAQWFGYCKESNKKVVLDERYVNAAGYGLD